MAALAIAGGAWWMLRPPDGFMTGVVPISATRAAFTMRHNPENGDARAWVGVLDVSGDVVWSQELPGVTFSIYAGHGMTVADDLLTIKVTDAKSFEQLLGFDPETGEQRWASPRLEFAEREASFNLPVVAGDRPYTDGAQLLHAHSDGEALSLVARNAADGATVWTHELEDHLRDLLVSPTAVAYRADTRWTFVRRHNGKVAQTVHAYAAACANDERFTTWDDDQLITVDWSDASFNVSKHALPSEGIPLHCGLAEDTPVFTVAHPWNDALDRRFELIAVDPATAGVAWRVDLGAWEPSMIATSRDNEAPWAHPLRGTLTDFVPVLLDTHGSDDVKLVVIDMAKHEVSWKSTPHPELLHFEVFRGRGDQYFLGDRGKVAVIDGATGRVGAAIELGHEGSRAFHAKHGQLWLFSMGWERMNALPWVQLDGDTLQVIGTGNSEFAPQVITDEFAGWLGATQ